MKYIYFIPFFFVLVAAPLIAAKASDIKIARKETVLAKEINLPQYGNFDEVTGRSVEFDALMQQFVPDTNRLLAVYIDKHDLETIAKNPQAGFRKYIMVQTLKQGIVFNKAEDFVEMKKAFAKEMEALAPSDIPEVGNMMNNISDYVQKNYNADMRVKVGESRNLGRIVDGDDRVGFLTLTNYGVTSAEGVIDYPVAGVSIVQNVRGRLLFIYTYLSDYKGEQEIEWVKATGIGFSDEVARANMSDDAMLAERGSAVRTVILVCLGALGGVMGAMVVMNRKQKDKTV